MKGAEAGIEIFCLPVLNPFPLDHVDIDKGSLIGCLLFAQGKILTYPGKKDMMKSNIRDLLQDIKIISTQERSGNLEMFGSRNKELV